MPIDPYTASVDQFAERIFAWDVAKSSRSTPWDFFHVHTKRAEAIQDERYEESQKAHEDFPEPPPYPTVGEPTTDVPQINTEELPPSRVTIVTSNEDLPQLEQISVDYYVYGYRAATFAFCSDDHFAKDIHLIFDPGDSDREIAPSSGEFFIRTAQASELLHELTDSHFEGAGYRYGYFFRNAPGLAEQAPDILRHATRIIDSLTRGLSGPNFGNR
jgi:hypothetical protein